MCSGVGKSGSPAPRSTTSMPCRRKRSASALTLSVGDGAICDIRRQSSCRPRVAEAPAPAGRLEARLLDDGRHQSADLAAEPEHFLDQPRARVGVLLGGHQEHRSRDRGREVPVHQRHLKLVLEVGHGAEAADRRRRALVAARNPRAGRSNVSTSTLWRPANTSRIIATRSSTVKSGVLFGLSSNRDDDAIEDARGALDDVDVAARERIERPGKTAMRGGCDGRSCGLEGQGAVARLTAPVRRLEPAPRRRRAGATRARARPATGRAMRRGERRPPRHGSRHRTADREHDVERIARRWALAARRSRVVADDIHSARWPAQSSAFSAMSADARRSCSMKTAQAAPRLSASRPPRRCRQTHRAHARPGRGWPRC